MSNRTILYLTDNSLDERLAVKCRSHLLEQAGEIPIVSVSQRPLDFGKNVVVGDIGRSWLSLYRQILAGLAVVETENVVICEHDCLYTPWHLNYQPADGGVFHYNANFWLVWWSDRHPELKGMYSYWPHRVAFSQLICRTALLQESTTEVMRLLEMGLQVSKGMKWHGEPGTVGEQFHRAYVEASSGRSTQLQGYLKDYVTKYGSMFFKTVLPNLDIRHNSNFTGAKRGKLRRYELAPWGRFADVMDG